MQSQGNAEKHFRSAALHVTVFALGTGLRVQPLKGALVLSLCMFPEAKHIVLPWTLSGHNLIVSAHILGAIECLLVLALD